MRREKVMRYGEAEATGPIRIVADDRERRAGVIDRLREVEDVTVVVERLVVGDYVIDDAFAIERKEAFDFAVSIMDGRLFRQARALSGSQYRAAFIVEGGVEDWKRSKISREALQGALISLMLIFDLPLLRSRDEEETARLITYLGRQYLRLRQGGSIPTKKARAKRRLTRQLRVLQALPGIGRHRARMLLDRYGSVRDCFNAPLESLVEIDGIGPRTAEGITEIVREDEKSYGTEEEAWEALIGNYEG